MRTSVVLGVAVMLAGSEAAADYKSDLERMAGEIKQTPPRPGVDQAGPASGARPAWCGPLTEAPYGGGMTSHLGSYYQAPDTKLYALVGAAQALCKNDTAHPVIKRATQEIVQLWMNAYGLSAPDAVESLVLTTKEGARDAGQKATCQALEIDGEVGGAERAFVVAKRHLFGCNVETSISLVSGATMEAAIPWLDSSAKPFDELVRLAFVSTETEAIVRSLKFGEREGMKRLTHYAIGQFDFKALDAKAALHALDNDPALKGNQFARVVVKETLGLTRLALLEVEAAVKKKTEKDPDWKEVLITAPQKGYNDYLAASAKYKAELQRSADMEQVMFGASRKAAAGCQKTLKADLVGILKPMKKDTLKDFLDSVNAHPVAGLLIRRYQACMAVDGQPDAAAEMRRMEHGIRVLRGPRQAAYYAVTDAIAKIKADRDKFPLEPGDVEVHRTDIIDKLTFDLMKGGNAGAYGVWDGTGVVKTVKKSKKGVYVVFAKDKQERYIESDCTTTNRIVTWDHDGRPIYYRKCKGGVQKVDVSPDPINIPEGLTEGVAPGRTIVFGVSNSADERISMPFLIYKDKKGKGLVTFYTIPLI